MRRYNTLTLALGLGACLSIDDRHLVATDGVAGAFAGGESGAGESGPGEAGAGGSAAEGEGGGAASTDGLVDGCADLDSDGIADCETTLVDNPSFSSDVSGWTPIGAAELSWDPENTLADQPSGSARLSSAPPLARALQCVALSGEQLVVAYASAFVEAAADEGGAQALLEVSFFESDDCSGARHGYFETPPSAVVDAWTTVQAGAVSRAETNSVSIALVGVISVAPVSVYFDNVMLKAQEL